MDSLGDRMKTYEAVPKVFLTRRMPVIVRVDGRAFHTYTKKADKPFDDVLMNCMLESARFVAKEMQGFKIGYIQSDEASFVMTDYDSIETEAWFANNLQKIVSISASCMTASFSRFMRMFNCDRYQGIATFDARAFVVPQEEVANYLLWRAKDWERNSLQMYARSCFSQKQLHGKKREDMHDMLKTVGKNWATDIDDRAKNGSFIFRDGDGFVDARYDILPTYESINDFIQPHIFPEKVSSENEG